MALVYTYNRDGIWTGLIDGVLVVLRGTDAGVAFEVWCGEEKPVHAGLAADLEAAKQGVWR